MTQPQPTTPEKDEVPIGDRIDQYIKLRDAADALKRKHKEQLAPYNKAMAQLEAMFQAKMLDLNLENLKSDNGTAYTTIASSVTVADWDLFFDFVMKEEAYHLLEKRAAKLAVQEVVEEGGELPPGLNMKRTTRVNVRRN